MKRSYRKNQIEILEIKSLMSEKKNTLNEINCTLDFLKKISDVEDIINYQTQNKRKRLKKNEHH